MSNPSLQNICYNLNQKGGVVLLNGCTESRVNIIIALVGAALGHPIERTCNLTYTDGYCDPAMIITDDKHRGTIFTSQDTDIGNIDVAGKEIAFFGSDILEHATDIALSAYAGYDKGVVTSMGKNGLDGMSVPVAVRFADEWEPAKMIEDMLDDIETGNGTFT